MVRNTAASLTLAVFIYPLSEDLGWSRTLIAGAASFGGLAASGVSPLVGWLIDRYGTRLILGLSVFVLGLATISLSWATIPITFYLAYGVGRVIFASPVQIGSSVVVSRWFIRMRGRAIGTLFMSHSIGMIAFPLIASAVIAGRGWQDAWMLLGLLVWAIALLPVVLLMAERPEDANFFGRRSLGAIRGVTEPFATLGQAIGALASGAAYDLTDSYGAAFIAFALLGAFTVVLVLFAKPPRRAGPAASGTSA